MENTIHTTNSCLQYISTLCHTVFLHRTVSVRFSYAVRFPCTVRLIPQIFTYNEFIASCFYENTTPTTNSCLLCISTLCHTVFLHRTVSVRFTYAVRFPCTVRLIPQIFTYNEFSARNVLQTTVCCGYCVFHNSNK